jgi:hypothetical protein
MDHVPPSLQTSTFMILVIAGIYFLLLGIGCIFAPATARRFLLGFATSAFKHYLEMTLRMIVGIAMLVHAPHLRHGMALTVFGWILVGTTVVLLLMPWTWHRSFAAKVLPTFVGFLPFIGIVSITIGSGLLFCLMRSS